MTPLAQPHRRTLLALGAAGLATTLPTPAPVGAAEDENDKGVKIELSKVPAVVRKAADAAVPKAKWTEAYKDDDNGKIVYELEGTDAKGRDVTVEVTADGKVTEVETEIPMAEVPAKVKAALKAKHEHFKVSTAHELKEDGKVVGYEFDGKFPKRMKEFVIFVSADAKTIEVEKD